MVAGVTRGLCRASKTDVQSDRSLLCEGVPYPCSPLLAGSQVTAGLLERLLCRALALPTSIGQRSTSLHCPLESL